jgi:hypothetical protein
MNLLLGFLGLSLGISAAQMSHGHTCSAVLSVAHESRILIESLGLARIFLSRTVSLSLVMARFTRAVSSAVGEAGQYKTVADSARLQILAGRTFPLAESLSRVIPLKFSR